MLLLILGVTMLAPLLSWLKKVYRSFQASPELTRVTFISAMKCCSAKIHKVKSSYNERKIDKLRSSPSY